MEKTQEWINSQNFCLGPQPQLEGNSSSDDEDVIPSMNCLGRGRDYVPDIRELRLPKALRLEISLSYIADPTYERQEPCDDASAPPPKKTGGRGRARLLKQRLKKVADRKPGRNNLQQQSDDQLSVGSEFSHTSSSFHGPDARCPSGSESLQNEPLFKHPMTPGTNSINSEPTRRAENGASKTVEPEEFPVPTCQFRLSGEVRHQGYRGRRSSRASRDSLVTDSSREMEEFKSTTSSVKLRTSHEFMPTNVPQQNDKSKNTLALEKSSAFHESQEHKKSESATNSRTSSQFVHKDVSLDNDNSRTDSISNNLNCTGEQLSSTAVKLSNINHTETQAAPAENVCQSSARSWSDNFDEDYSDDSEDLQPYQKQKTTLFETAYLERGGPPIVYKKLVKFGGDQNIFHGFSMKHLKTPETFTMDTDFPELPPTASGGKSHVSSTGAESQQGPDDNLTSLKDLGSFLLSDGHQPPDTDKHCDDTLEAFRHQLVTCDNNDLPILHIKNLPAEISDSEETLLLEMLQFYGSLLLLRFIPEESSTTAVVQLDTEEAANLAQECFDENDSIFCGRTLSAVIANDQ